MIHASERIQPFGYLAWAACGKDPGFSPGAILEHAARSTRYSAAEVRALAFDGPPPDPGDLSRRWHATQAEAQAIVDLLPPAEAGRCVLAPDGTLFRGDVAALRAALDGSALIFHAGTIRGALPVIKSC